MFRKREKGLVQSAGDPGLLNPREKEARCGGEGIPDLSVGPWASG